MTDPRLLSLLGGEPLALLRQRLRRYFERQAPEKASGLLRLGDLTADEHEALALLMGRPPRQLKSLQIDVAALDAALREAGIADSLREALAQLDGPFEHRSAMRTMVQARWAAIATTAWHPLLTAWLQAPAALGLLKRLTKQDSELAGRLLERAGRVLQRLPAAGMPRAQLAAQVLGDAHALDGGHPVATLVLAVLRSREAEAGVSARELWSAVGVAVNELARPALFLNLPVQTGETPVCVMGEPAYLSLRRLLRKPPGWTVNAVQVFVCENPNLLAIAADALGPTCAPLVCTDGMPAAAQRVLLTQLSEAGADLHYHGDFDWPGLQIGNLVMRRFLARPWRFETSDYEAAAAQTSEHPACLAGDAVAASWDTKLAPAMQTRQLAIAEEALAAPLLDDLRHGLEERAPGRRRDQ